MYSINYIDGVITKEKYGSALVRFLKVLNFFVHIGIIAILIFSVLAYLKIGYYNVKIDETKKEIEEKRITNRISDIEKEWEILYYKLLAVKTQLDHRTSYSFIFRDLGTYLPVDNTVLDLSFKGDISSVHLTITNSVLKSLTSFYDYTPVLNAAFEKSSYIGHDVLIQDLENQKINKAEVKALKVAIPLNSRKR
ncbi:MAG: hypothetical protein K5622_01720 [Endomicrobiaceae bacterium]|nr:hypothetical protein [Endomicrobiaceae bacterium]